jgi:hypothetical protein
VAERIVHRLEIVEIQAEHRAALASVHPEQRFFHTLTEENAVR